MAKAKASTKQQTKTKEKVDVQEITVETNPTPENEKKAAEPKRSARAKPVKAEEPAPVAESKPKKASKAAKETKEKEESKAKSTSVEPQTNGGGEKPKPAKKPASKREATNGDAAEKGRGKKQEQATAESPPKRARKAETKEEEQPPKKRGKKQPAAEVAKSEEEKSDSESPEKPAVAPKKKATKSVVEKEKSDSDSPEKPAAAPKKKAPTKATAKAKSKSPDKPAPSPKKKAAKEAEASVAVKKLQNSTTSDYNIEFNIKEAYNTKIVTWNVAGVRSCAQKGCVDYLRRENADIICLNELKVATEKDIPDEVKLADYYHYWNISKGNPGVAILSKKKPLNVTNDLPEKFTSENRLITAEYEDFYLVSCYVVNAGRGLKTLDKRMEWNDIFDAYIQKLDKEKPVIIAGDLNVAHNEIDLANPKINTKNAGFTKQERDGFSKLLSYGFIDTFRDKNPDQEGAYTFWSYMGGSRARNVGWRLDYFVASERIMDSVVDNVIRSTIKGSDHCPIVLFLDL